MCYTVGVNRVGTDANKMLYSGHSATYDCLGEKIANSEEYKEGIEIVRLEKSHISKIRTKLNFLADSDSFKL